MTKKLKWNYCRPPEDTLILFEIRNSGRWQTYIGENDATEMFDASKNFLALYDTDVVRWVLYSDINKMIGD